MTESICNIYSAFKEHGLKSNQVKSLLPSWWNDKIAETPAGLQQAKIIIAKALNLKLIEFLDNPAKIVFDLPNQKSFKLRKGTSEDDVTLAIAIARSVSKLTLSNFDKKQPSPKIESALNIRTKILGSGKSWVDLDSLLDYCWSIGIPVIHLNSPLMKKKMDGVAMYTKGLPTIVLSSQKKNGYLLFHLAHEMGHFYYGHLNSSTNDARVDKAIGRDKNNLDKIEQAADLYALDLLAGDQCKLNLSRFCKPEALAELAISFGLEHKIDPTHVLLNSAHNGNFWPLCTNTLKILGSRSSEIDQEVIARHLFNNISPETKEDDLELLRKLVGIA